MDKFEEFMKNSKEKFTPNMGGAFECQTCDAYVRDAYHDRANGLLIWKCPEGHTSHLKDFHL